MFGLALAMIGVSGFVTMRVAGLVLDRLGGRGLPVAVPALAAAAVLPSLAPSSATLIAALALLGATSGAFYVAANAEGTRFETATDRPLLNLAHALFSIGVVGGSVATGLAFALLTSWPPFVCVAFVLMLLAVVTLVLEPAPTERAGEGEKSVPLWRAPLVLLFFGLLGTMAYFVENAWQSWSAVYLAGPLGRSAGPAAVGPACFAGAAGLGSTSRAQAREVEPAVLGPRRTFLAFRCYTKSVQLQFFRGTWLDPVPPKASKHDEVRYFDIHEDDDLDEDQLAWIEQASKLPGEKM
jgi:MFS family permease